MLMKLLPIVAMLACLLTTVPLFGQAAPAAAGQETYVVINYLKIDPANTAAYEEMVRTTLRQFYVEALKQPGTNLVGWSMVRVLYRGTDDDTPTHVGAICYAGPPPGRH